MNSEAGYGNKGLDFMGAGAELIRVLSFVTHLTTDVSRRRNGSVHTPAILGSISFRHGCIQAFMLGH